jgi:hypothetical protein
LYLRPHSCFALPIAAAGFSGNGGCRSVSVSNFFLPPRSGGTVAGCRLSVVSQMIRRKSKRNHWLVINQRNEQIIKLPMAQRLSSFGLDMVGLQRLVG